LKIVSNVSVGTLTLAKTWLVFVMTDKHSSNKLGKDMDVSDVIVVVIDAVGDELEIDF
jgi:hypothetical protein